MKKLLTLFAALFLGLLVIQPVSAASHPFVDVSPYAWYAGSVEHVHELGLMNGVAYNRFAPDQKMTRGMLVAVLYRYEGTPKPSGHANFSDVKETAYYADAVDWAWENAIVEGTGDGIFDPNRDITREQLVTIFYRYAHNLGGENGEGGDLSGFSDGDSVAAYAREAFAWAVDTGLVEGADGKLNPKGTATRSQCAAIISRFDGRSLDEDPVHENTTLAVLMYHAVVADGSNCGEWSVTESTFRNHMNWLTDHGYTSVLPSQLAAGEPLPKKAVLITFDDGYMDNYTRAFPILEETGHKAVIALVTSYLGERSEFMTWEMAQEMEQSGIVEFGSHTHNLHKHPGLRRQEGESREAYEERVFSDLSQSIRLMEEHFGHRPLLIAYPHGIVDPWIEDFANDCFQVTLYGVGEINDVKHGLRGLTRCNVNEETDIALYLEP